MQVFLIIAYSRRYKQQIIFRYFTLDSTAKTGKVFECSSFVLSALQIQKLSTQKKGRIFNEIWDMSNFIETGTAKFLGEQTNFFMAPSDIHNNEMNLGKQKVTVYYSFVPCI